MKYLIIGSGGREHCIAWRLISDGSADEVFVAPGNGGIDRRYRADIQPNEFKKIEAFCREKGMDMVIVGPEAPLVGGLVDHLEASGIKAFGPSGKAAMLEGSKLFAKSIMKKYGVPTANHWDFTGRIKVLEFIETVSSYPIVIKLDGLAAGKGVAVPSDKNEAVEFIRSNVKDDSRVFIEEYLEGEEVSVLGISDGETVIPLIAAQDHKRIFDGDAGPNTGGMGAYSPAPVLTGALMEKVKREVLVPTINGMKKEGARFRGILYAGLMIRDGKINVLEFNARFGDPETQVILPLLEGKLGDLFRASVDGNLSKTDISFKNSHAITVVMASRGYPGSYEKGKEITGLDQVAGDITVFHAGTENTDGKIITSGGRVLNVTAVGNSLKSARDRVYSEIEKIKFDGAYFRKDIAYRALK
ncbi:MAG: phosphoribosylamine--glycine ligase [Spirochaetes bacterium]|jgi:phosphoribosylamine--glycine ligase|nr:phosphoribosylamine--glycine ligase [Spirochaetota bacterium]